MNPLEAMLRPAARLLNETIAETTPARELCRELEGTVATLRVRNTAIAVSCRVLSDHIELTPGAADDPDVAITGSLFALGRLATTHDENLFRNGSVELLGDAETARTLQRLLAYARPDPEEQLSRIVGDPAAHAAGRFVRGVRRWARDARTTMTANLREYLQEEGRDVPSRYEVERFGREVDALRDDVDRLAVRIDRLGDRH
jgi:ubiquinone biosynthesis protein UbiJ